MTMSPNKDIRKAPLPKINRRRYRVNFIVKPDCMSQGKGIFLTNDLDSIS